MNDVPAAPTGQGAAPTPAPATPAQGVPIDPAPVRTPNPVGSQAPERQGVAPDHQGSQHRPQSRREAILAAFERASTPQQAPQKAAPRPAPKAAEAKPGHNQPPEPTPKEQPGKLDLKKRPSEQEPQPRGERGQFAPRLRPAETPPSDNGPAPAAHLQSGQPGTQSGQPVRELPSNAPFREPLPRMSERARADWHATPESVRGDMHRVAQEFYRAYNAYKADHEAMNPIRQFHQMAAEHGTTLERALTNYVGMEQKLRSDLVGGLDLIVNNLGLKTADGQRITLRDVAYHILSQTPEQLRVMQQGNQQQATNQQLGALMQEIASLRNTVQQMHNHQQFRQTRGTVDQYAQTHPRFDELADLIEREIKLGFPLDEAYRRANLLRPSTQAAQTRDTSAQTRAPTTDRSISGAPAGGGHLNGSARGPDKPTPSRREALQNAFRRAGSL